MDEEKRIRSRKEKLESISKINKKSKQEKWQDFIIKLGVKLSGLGFIGFCIYFVIKFIMCTFFGFCII
jgi:preprotein translocase subunit Sss1